MSEIVSHRRRGGRGVLSATLAWLAPTAGALAAGWPLLPAGFVTPSSRRPQPA
jgi:hypothetical protein